ncbi:hypothetical protein ACB092_06G228200 [Castanea dentata]
MLDHIRCVDTPKAACDTFVTLFSKKNVKSFYCKISELDLVSNIFDSRMRRIIIHGLRPEYRSFVVAIQGWSVQPSLVQLENLLSDQEALIKQMAVVSLKSEEEAVFSSQYKDRPKRRFNACLKNRNNEDRKDEESSQDGGAQGSRDNNERRSTSPKNRNVKCFKCGKMGNRDTNLVEKLK